MLKRKPLLLFAVAFAMVVLFATTVAIAGPPAPVSKVVCGNGSYTLSFVGFDNVNKEMIYSLTGSERNLSFISKVYFAQDEADSITNAMTDCVFGVGGTGNNKWLQDVYGMCTYTSTPVSGEVGQKIIRVPVSNSFIGGIDAALDGGKIGLQLCEPSQIFGAGTKPILGVQECKTEVLSWDPIEYVDGDGNTQTVKPADCKVQSCASAGSISRTVLEGDCYIKPTEPIGDILPGVTALPEFANFNTTMSPDNQCTYYNGDGSCAAPCCPNYLPFVPDGSCLPTPDCV